MNTPAPAPAPDRSDLSERIERGSAWVSDLDATMHEVLAWPHFTLR